MRLTLLLLAVGVFVIAMFSLGPRLGGDRFRGGVKELVALVESQVLGYEPLP